MLAIWVCKKFGAGFSNQRFVPALGLRDVIVAKHPVPWKIWVLLEDIAPRVNEARSRRAEFDSPFDLAADGGVIRAERVIRINDNCHIFRHTPRRIQ